MSFFPRAHHSCQPCRPWYMSRRSVPSAGVSQRGTSTDLTLELSCGVLPSIISARRIVCGSFNSDERFVAEVDRGTTSFDRGRQSYLENLGGRTLLSSRRAVNRPVSE